MTSICDAYHREVGLKAIAGLLVGITTDAAQSFVTAGLFRFAKLIWYDRRALELLEYNIGGVVTAPVTAAVVAASVVRTVFEKILPEPSSENVWKKRAYKYVPDAAITGALAIPLGPEAAVAYGLYRAAAEALHALHEYSEAPIQAEKFFINYSTGRPPALIPGPIEQPVMPDDVLPKGSASTDSSQGKLTAAKPKRSWPILSRIRKKDQLEKKEEAKKTETKKKT